MAYSSIVKPTDYFNTVLYSGTGSSQAITGVGFQPDWIWFKCRSQNQNHNLFDVIRGSNKIIQTSTSNAEATSTDLLTSFDSDGFTVNTDGGVNGSGQTYASWNWLASNTTASNSDGSITSTVSANTTAGFSIVSFDQTSSPQTIGHGLNSVPKIIFIKDRDSSSNWQVYSESIGASNKLLLDSTNASASSGVFNSTAPTSSVFTFNADYGSTIAYCFAEKKGYSKFGSYTGNGNDDGTFVYTGFKPAWIIIKESSHSGNAWHIRDIKRSPINVVDDSLYANANNTETTNNSALTTDFLSNGFKLRNTDTNNNASGRTYIYMAFAENPFVANDSGTAVPVVAR